MARIARVSLVGIPYHVTQRGNGRQRVFFSEPDYSLYLDLLQRNAERYRLQIWAYCLMPNHVHFVVVPEGPASLAKAFGRTHADYARHFNLQQRSGGHVWQARFYSCPLDGPSAWRALAYLERNPLRAGLVGAAEDYPWSSARVHCGEEDRLSRLDLSSWYEMYTAERWREVLRVGVEEAEFRERLRRATSPARTPHTPPAAACGRPASSALRLVRVLGVLSSTPPGSNQRAP